MFGEMINAFPLKVALLAWFNKIVEKKVWLY